MTVRAGSVLASAPLPDPGAARRVREFGGRPRRADGWRGITVWSGSFVIHALIAAVAFLATWTVVARTVEDDAPVVTLIDFRAPVYDPVTAPPESDTPAQPEATTPAPAQIPSAATAGLDRSAPLIPADSQGRALAPLSMESTGRAASFAGLRASNARRIVYVVDASGSLVGTFPAIARELEGSLSRLDHRQSFAIIFFQRNEALTVPPGTLLPATSANVGRAVEWIRNQVFPAGRSNPIAALTQAMSLQPDLLFLLSTDITGAGEFEVSVDELLAAVNRLNPISSRSGRRKTRIQCVEFLDRDPERVLERLAELHGGPGAFRFLSRDELGLTPGAPGASGKTGTMIE